MPTDGNKLSPAVVAARKPGDTIKPSFYSTWRGRPSI